MPLMSAAIAAIPDDHLRVVRFVMKDGTKPVVVMVSQAALEDAERAPLTESDYFHRFKQYRRLFEQMASYKYDRGYVEIDGSVCIRAKDLPLDSTN
jgi:uncharacterized protein DUF1488